MKNRRRTPAPRGHRLVCRWRKGQRFVDEHHQYSAAFTAWLSRFFREVDDASRQARVGCSGAQGSGHARM